MTTMGPVETSLREQAIAARRRLAGSVPVKVIERIAVEAARPPYRRVVASGVYSPPRKPQRPARVEPLPVEPVYLPGEAPAPQLASAMILKEVAVKHGVTVQEILGAARSAWLIPARHEAMYRIREERQLSWAQIGRMMNRDHTSVLHGWSKHKARMEAAAG